MEENKFEDRFTDAYYEMLVKRIDDLIQDTENISKDCNTASQKTGNKDSKELSYSGLNRNLRPLTTHYSTANCKAPIPTEAKTDAPKFCRKYRSLSLKKLAMQPKLISDIDLSSEWDSDEEVKNNEKVSEDKPAQQISVVSRPEFPAYAIQCDPRPPLKASSNRFKEPDKYLQLPNIAGLNLNDNIENKMPHWQNIQSDNKKYQYINKRPYMLIKEIGTGGSCTVCEAWDMSQNRIVAVKHVTLEKLDDACIQTFCNEIELLKKLQGNDRVIKLFDYEYIEKKSLIVVLERGDTDLSKFIKTRAQKEELTSEAIKFYWKEMLTTVNSIHKAGIVHADLKPANLLLVEGQLKLIDFGIASSIQPDFTSITRESVIGTYNYISPEALIKVTTPEDVKDKKTCYKIGVKSDVWSLGCILYSLVYGKTPFQDHRSLMEKFHAITSPKIVIPFPEIEDKLLLDVLKKCLIRDPKQRWTTEQLLKHPYLTSKKQDESPSSVLGKNLCQLGLSSNYKLLTPRRQEKLNSIIDKMSKE